jgi:pyruvate dehydrogenase E1 component
LVKKLLEPTQGPILGVSDWVRSFPDQIARWAPRKFISLGTDGFGMSDTRTALRRSFGIDGPSIAQTVLTALAREGRIPAEIAAQARRDLELDADSREKTPVPEPETVPAGNGQGRTRTGKA